MTDEVYPITNAFPEESNEEIIESWRGDPWFPAIKWAYDRIIMVDHGLRIDQIKPKFGGLRFYYTPSDYGDESKTREIDWYITAAEHWVSGYEKGRRDSVSN